MSSKFTQEDDMGRFFSFLAGSLVGSILGVSAIVLLTPVSGKDVRDALRKELSTIIDEGRRAAKAKTAEMEKHLADLRGETAA
ncbi:MAG: hypothetical protein ABIV92_19385 [Thermoflexales bacterium]